jgi:hypothetical protein
MGRMSSTPIVAVTVNARSWTGTGDQCSDTEHPDRCGDSEHLDHQQHYGDDQPDQPCIHAAILLEHSTDARAG